MRHLLSFGELVHPPAEICEVGGGLERYERPLPVMNEYDLLLGAAMTEAEVAP